MQSNFSPIFRFRQKCLNFNLVREHRSVFFSLFYAIIEPAKFNTEDSYALSASLQLNNNSFNFPVSFYNQELLRYIASELNLL